MAEMKEYVLKPTNGKPDVRFTGVLEASVSSQRNGSTQWTVLNAYLTKAGKWVIESIGDTSLDYLERRVSVYVFEYTEDMTAKIGFGRLAAKLYRELGIDEISVD